MSVLRLLHISTGRTETQAEYYFHKVAQTALLALGIFAWHILWQRPADIFRDSVWAVPIYLLISKAVVRYAQHDWLTFWRDGHFYARLFYIAALISVVPALTCGAVYGRTVMLQALVAWVLIFLIADAAGMGGV